MDKKQKNKKNFFSSRKFKYGTAATVFTVFFIAVVILLNAIVSAVDSKYSLYFDLTDDQIFSISDETVKMVEQRLNDYEKEHGQKPEIKIITRKPITASEEEIKENSRSKCAKLRIAVRI